MSNTISTPELMKQLDGAAQHRTGLETMDSSASHFESPDAQKGAEKLVDKSRKDGAAQPIGAVTAAQRDAEIRNLVKSYQHLFPAGTSNKESSIIQNLQRSKLSYEQVKELFSAMDSAMASARDEYKVTISKGFAAILDPASKVNLTQADRDTERPQTLVDHIKTLVATPAEAFQGGRNGLGGRKDEILASLLTEIADPDRNINQGTDTSCVSTVGMNQLVRQHPAEYARFITELATLGDARLITANGTRLSDRIAGRQMEGGDPLKNSEPMLRLDPMAIESANAMKRSITEAMFQAGAGKAFGAVSGGLFNGAAEKCYENIFGKAFERIDANDASRAITEIKKAMEIDGGVNMVSVKWAVKGTHCSHALEVKKIDGETVCFRNPWGKEFQNIPQGVGAVKVDGEASLYKMSLSEFKSRINYAIVSSSGAGFGVTKGNDESQPDFNADAHEQRTIIFSNDTAPVKTSYSPPPEQQKSDKKTELDEKTSFAEQPHLKKILKDGDLMAKSTPKGEPLPAEASEAKTIKADSEYRERAARKKNGLIKNPFGDDLI